MLLNPRYRRSYFLYWLYFNFKLLRALLIRLRHAIIDWKFLFGVPLATQATWNLLCHILNWPMQDSLKNLQRARFWGTTYIILASFLQDAFASCKILARVICSMQGSCNSNAFLARLMCFVQDYCKIFARIIHYLARLYKVCCKNL